MELSPDDLVKVLLAIAVGGAIGIERELRDKAAGFRTLIFICLGSTLFTIFSIKIALFGDTRFDGSGDATRIASNIVAGVGFLGAGVILRDRGRVIGLTTAAMVWLVAALGMGIGAAEYAFVFAVTGLTLLVLVAFPRVESWIDHVREERSYEVVASLSAAKLAALNELFRGSGLRVLHHQQTKHHGRMTCVWKVSGPLAVHERLVGVLMADGEVEALRY